MQTKISKNQKSGYAILELLFYIGFFSVLALVVINSMIVMSGSFKETAIQADLIRSGNIMETLSREIRQAIAVNSISTTDLVLDTKDSSDVAKTVEFVLVGSDIQFLENGVLTGNLNSSNIVVSALSFTQVDTLKSNAIKISFTARSLNDKQNRTFNFYDTVVLRGSYH